MKKNSKILAKIIVKSKQLLYNKLKLYKYAIKEEQDMKETRNAFSFSDEDGALEAAAISYLKDNGLTVAFAESCTGGLASKRMVDMPGASAVFVGSVV